MNYFDSRWYCNIPQTVPDYSDLEQGRFRVAFKIHIGLILLSEVGHSSKSSPLVTTFSKIGPVCRHNI